MSFTGIQTDEFVALRRPKQRLFLQRVREGGEYVITTSVWICTAVVPQLYSDEQQDLQSCSSLAHGRSKHPPWSRGLLRDRVWPVVRNAITDLDRISRDSSSSTNTFAEASVRLLTADARGARRARDHSPSHEARADLRINQRRLRPLTENPTKLIFADPEMIRSSCRP